MGATWRADGREPQQRRISVPLVLTIVAVLTGGLPKTENATSPPGVTYLGEGAQSLPLRRLRCSKILPRQGVSSAGGTMREPGWLPNEQVWGREPCRPGGAAMGAYWSTNRMSVSQQPAAALCLRGGSKYATMEDFRRAGVEYNEEGIVNWGKLWRSRKWEEPEPSDSDNLDVHEGIQGVRYKVCGLNYNEGYDDEVTTLMMIRLAIERANYDELIKAMHNAEQLDEADWTDRVEEAYKIADGVQQELWKKAAPRMTVLEDEEYGSFIVTQEQKNGYRVPIPPALRETGTTNGDTLWGPRDGATRLRLDENMTMDENFALWDALDSHTIRTRLIPQVENLTFDDPYLEEHYQLKVDEPPETYPNVALRWTHLKELAIARAEEAIRLGERGEVGSEWYHAEKAPEHAADMHPEGAWWYIRGHVQRMPGLYDRNGEYTWEKDGQDDEGVLEECCPSCGYCDCPVNEWEISRIGRMREYRGGKEPSFDPLDIAMIAGLSKATLNKMLINATDCGDLNATRKLLAAGANVSCVADDSGNTPLHYAAAVDREDIVHLLVTKWGADIEARTCTGARPLHHAAHAGNMRMCELLVSLGADVDARCDQGFTPLMEAVDETHNFTVSKLLQLGADAWAENCEGEYALNIAEQRYASDISMLLRKVMGLPLCECHMCAGYTTGYNNFGVTHMVHEGSAASFWKSWPDYHKDMYPKTFWEEMRDEDEKSQKLMAEEVAKGPQGFDNIDGTGGYGPLNKTWYLEKGERVKERICEDYEARYGGEGIWTEPSEVTFTHSCSKEFTSCCVLPSSLDPRP